LNYLKIINNDEKRNYLLAIILFHNSNVANQYEERNKIKIDEK
jgi:hypothetical protein